MAMKTPEKQILPIAPAYPDINSLGKWAGDLTRTLQQNLATIARKANDDSSFVPVGNLNMNGFSITNIANLGNISGTITYKGADIDDRFVNVTGDTMTGNLFINISSAADAFVVLNNTVGAGALRTGAAGNTIFAFDDTHGFFINKYSKANIANGSFASGTALWSMTNAGAVTMTAGLSGVTSIAMAGALSGATTGNFSGLVTGSGGFSGVIGATGPAAGTFTTVTGSGALSGFTTGAFSSSVSMTALTATTGTFSGAVAANAGITTTLSPNTNPVINVGGNLQTIASGAELALSNNSGLLVLSNTTSGSTGVVALGGGTVSIISAGGGTEFVNSSTPSASQTGIYFSSPTYRIKNGFAGSRNYGILWLGSRNSV